MRKYIKILFLTVCPMFGMAQNPMFEPVTKGEADSLRLLLGAAINDTIRMAAFRSISYYYQDIDWDSSLLYSENRLALSKQLKQKLWEAEGYDMLGYNLNNTNNHAGALKAYMEGLKIAEDAESEKNVWRVSQFSAEKNPYKARLNILASLLHDIGHLYGSTGNSEKQLEKYFESEKIVALLNDIVLFSGVYSSIGSTYLGLGKLDSALIYHQKGLHYANLAGFQKNNGGNYKAIGWIYFRKENLDSALCYYKLAVTADSEQQMLTSLPSDYNSLASAYFKMNKIDSSLFYAKKALDASLHVNTAGDILYSYNSLALFYESRNQYDSGYLYLKLAYLLNDSLKIAENKNLAKYEALSFEEKLRLQELEKEKIENKNKIRAYTMLGGLVLFLSVGLILFKSNRQKQKANKTLENALLNLKATQSQLIQSEKMASLGELTAGIAHEIQNPLNFVNNFSEVNKEMIVELKEEINRGNYDEVIIIANDIEANSEKISHHGKRADAIVKGMLQHSRSSTGQKELTDINALADEYLRLAYHGLRAKDKDFNATMKTDFDETIGNINIIPQDIGRVLLNLYNNAFYAVNEKLKSNPDSYRKEPYEPTVTVSTKKDGNKVLISVKDNGNGIPQNIVDKIFQPFFTTKPTGQGTGLGLSLAYDIVKSHGGEINAEPDEGTGSTFIIVLHVT